MRSLIRIIQSDLRIFSKGSLIRSLLTIFFNSSFGLLLNYRIGNYLHHRRNYLTNIWILYLKKKQLEIYNCDISYAANLGQNVTFPHPIGIVIGTGCIIKNNVKIWQHVTLGSIGKSEMTYPTINENVKIYSHAQIIGNVVIGKNSIVGASAVVIRNVPENKTAVGIPAKIID